MDRVDLLVVNYNTKDKLKRLLETLHEDDNGSWNLYIADNGSSDGSDSWLQEHKSEYCIEAIHFNPNVGYALAVNLMARDSSSKYLAAINADVWMTSEDVLNIKEFMDKTPNIGVVGPKQRDERGRITHGGIVGTNSAPKQRDWQKLDPDDRLHRSREKVVTVSGAAFFMPRTVWDEMEACPIYQDFHVKNLGREPDGAFPGLPHYYEETMFAYHCKDHGYDVWYDGTVSIGHTWRASTGADPILKEYFLYGRGKFRTFCQLHNIECD